MRKTIIKIVTFLAGLYFFLEWIIPEVLLDTIFPGDNGFSKIHEKISDGFILVGAMAIGLGIINLVRVYGAKIIYKRKDYFFSYALLFGLVLMLVVAVFDWRSDIQSKENVRELRMLSEFSKIIEEDVKSNKENVLPFSKRIELLKIETKKLVPIIKNELISFETILEKENKDILKFKNNLNEEIALLTKLKLEVEKIESLEDLSSFSKLLYSISVIHSKQITIVSDYSLIKKLWVILFNGLFVSLGSAMFSLLGVYIASAAFRAFRITSYESAFMMFAALLVMLGQIPFGQYIYYDMPLIREWLLVIPNSAAFRAIKIGASIAGLVLAYRMWFSIESDYKDEG